MSCKECLRKPYIAYNLQFFADGNGGEKTEAATPKKMTDARKEGQVAKSQDIPVAFSLLALFLIVKALAGWLGERFIKTFQLFYGAIEESTHEGLNVGIASNLLKEALIQVFLIGAPFFFIILIVLFVSNMAQVKMVFSLKPLMPKFDKCNPINGFKRMFSKDKLFDLLKAVVKIFILGLVIYNELKDSWGVLIEFYRMDLMQAVELIGSIVIDLGIKISAIFLFIAFVDWFYQKRKFAKDMRMTKQEVKDEYKNTEGDPKIKGRIRQVMQQASRRRMMAQVPNADVVITNPTHLAVAIRYDRDKDQAPIVLAKGADYVAEKIKVLAREHSIEIVENKPLARMLYYNVDLEAEIPPQLYQMVAEVLALVYGKTGKAS